jgi:hypothetical protein
MKGSKAETSRPDGADAELEVKKEQEREEREAKRRAEKEEEAARLEKARLALKGAKKAAPSSGLKAMIAQRRAVVTEVVEEEGTVQGIGEAAATMTTDTAVTEPLAVEPVREVESALAAAFGAFR